MYFLTDEPKTAKQSLLFQSEQHFGYNLKFIFDMLFILNNKRSRLYIKQEHKLERRKNENFHD